MITAYACKVRMSGLYVQIKKVEYNAVGQVAEAAIIDGNSLSCVYHLLNSVIHSIKRWLPFEAVPTLI